MDIVSELPFVFKVITEHNIPIIQNTTQFILSGAEPFSGDFVTATIEENDNVSIIFNCSDADARLYFEALDGIPSEYDIERDEYGDIFCHPSTDTLPLYRQGNEFDAFRIGRFSIRVVCNNREYIGFLDVKPKQLSSTDWQIMKEDLEQEINGLAQDLVRRNIGLGLDQLGNIPPKQFQKFLSINKHAKAVVAALMDIKEKPRFSIQKQYQAISNEKARESDAESIKRTLRNPHMRDELFSPIKKITYDLKENRLLKYMLNVYEIELKRFIFLIDETLEHFYQNVSKRNFPNTQRDYQYVSGLEQFRASAEKLSKLTHIVKTQPWFSEISNLTDRTIPHSFALDSRYGSIYKMFRELTSDHFSIKLDPKYSYSWKKSSELYEMWCFVKVCREFSNLYTMKTNWLDTALNQSLLFPFLKQATCVSFEGEKVKIDVIYDQILPRDNSQCNANIQPLFMIGQHVRPDITINLYHKQKNMYIGSIILECKYRKIANFLYGKTQSSREQILEYYQDARSNYYHNGVFINHDIRPVHKVIVITPDILGTSNSPKGKRVKKEDHVLIKSLIPNHNEMLDDLFKIIRQVIDERILIADE